MNPRIEEILATLDAQLADLRSAVDAVPDGSRARRPSADRWSVAEVLEHLALVESSVAKVCVKQLRAARAAGLGQESETASVLHLLPPATVANRARRLSAPEALNPRGLDADAAWAEIEAVRDRFREFVASCDGLALGEVTFPHPALGPLNLYQWFLFAAGHHARHAAQIREIATQLS